MPSTPFAKVLVSVNGGATASGGLTVPPSATIAFTPESIVGWLRQRWEIVDYPEGWTAPVGWSTAADGTIFSADVTPPGFTLPSISLWGKWALRLLINEQIDDSLNVHENLLDTSTMLSMLSPAGLRDLAAREDEHFTTPTTRHKKWVRDVQRNWRILESVAIGGEANTASNQGGAVGLVMTKAGVDLPFKSLEAGTGITLTPTANKITIAATTTGEANTSSNVGGGAGLAKTKSGVNLPFKTLVEGTGIDITEGTDTVTISATGGVGGGEANTASNQGSGVGLAMAKNVVDLPFKSLEAGTGITITPASDKVTIAATTTGEANTSSNVGAGAQLAKTKSGVNLPFRTLVEGTGIDITEGTDTVTIAVVGGLTAPTGTGFVTVTGGVVDAAASTTFNAATYSVTYTGAASGGMLVFNGTKYANIPKGTANQFWRMDAVGGSPGWTTVAIIASTGVTGTVQVSNGSGGLNAATNVLAGLGYISLGAGAVHTTASLRFAYAATDVIVGAKDSTATDRKIISRNGAEQVQFSDAGYSTTYEGYTATLIGRTGGVQIYSGAGTTYTMSMNGAIIAAALPIVGLNSVYGAHGDVAVAAFGNYTLVAAEYSKHIIRLTSSGGFATKTFPHPAAGAGYTKKVDCSSLSEDVTISTGTGTTATAPYGLVTEFAFTSAGVKRVS